MDRNNNIFKITFLISLIIHAVFLIPLPKLKKNKNSINNTPYLNYLTLKVPTKKRIARFKHKKLSLRDRIKAKKALKKGRNSEPVPENKKRQQAKIKEQRQVVTSTSHVQNEELFKNKSYISYYRLINEKIRESVICPLEFSEGEIALSFILGSDGYLRNIEVTESTLIKDDVLRETAMQIVRNAAPFPPFPKSIQHDQLTFNIIFCFKESS